MCKGIIPPPITVGKGENKEKEKGKKEEKLKKFI